MNFNMNEKLIKLLKIQSLSGLRLLNSNISFDRSTMLKIISSLVNMGIYSIFKSHFM